MSRDVQCVCLCVGRESHQCRGRLGICDGCLLSCCFTRTHVVRAFCEQFSLKLSLPLGEIIDYRIDLSFLLLSCHDSPDERRSEMIHALICSYESLHAHGNKHNKKLVVLLCCIFLFPWVSSPRLQTCCPSSVVNACRQYIFFWLQKNVNLYFHLQLYDRKATHSSTSSKNLPPVMSLSGKVALWVMWATGFEKNEECTSVLIIHF